MMMTMMMMMIFRHFDFLFSKLTYISQRETVPIVSANLLLLLSMAGTYRKLILTDNLHSSFLELLWHWSSKSGTFGFESN